MWDFPSVWDGPGGHQTALRSGKKKGTQRRHKPSVCLFPSRASQLPGNPTLMHRNRPSWAFRGDRAGQSLPHASTKSHPPLTYLNSRSAPSDGLKFDLVVFCLVAQCRELGSVAQENKPAQMLERGKERKNFFTFNLPSVFDRLGLDTR